MVSCFLVAPERTLNLHLACALSPGGSLRALGAPRNPQKRWRFSYFSSRELQEASQRLPDASQASRKPPRASWKPPGSHREASWRPPEPPRSLQELTWKLPRDLLNLQEASRRPPGSFPETWSRHPGTPDCFHQPPESSSKPCSLEIPRLA